MMTSPKEIFETLNPNTLIDEVLALSSEKWGDKAALGVKQYCKGISKFDVETSFKCIQDLQAGCSNGLAIPTCEIEIKLHQLKIMKLMGELTRKQVSTLIPNFKFPVSPLKNSPQNVGCDKF